MAGSAGGERGIRTPDTLPGMPVFKTGAINHSAISPQRWTGRKGTGPSRLSHVSEF
jgi:hypothetical protein